MPLGVGDGALLMRIIWNGSSQRFQSLELRFYHQLTRNFQFKNLTRACEISRGRTISRVNLTKSRVHLTRIPRTSRVHLTRIPRTSRVHPRVHPAYIPN